MSDNKFYDHLDICEQCRKHPFDLCPAGAALIEVVARELAPNEMRQPGKFSGFGSIPTTGRQVSQPEMQDIRPLNELGRKIRDIFKSKGADLSALNLDYSALEMRVMAGLGEFHYEHKTKDPECPMCAMGMPKVERPR